MVVFPASAGDDEAPGWMLDPVHTRVMFAVSHAGFSQALGTISGSQGVLHFDPADWSRTRLQATVPLDRLDLGDEAWNRAVLAANLLDARRYPQARFVSSDTTPTGPDQARVCGELTLHGVTRPFCLDVTVNAVKRHPMPPFRRTAGFSATGQLLRSDYGITAWSSVIGDQVSLRIEAEAVRSRKADDEQAEPEPSETIDAPPTLDRTDDDDVPAADPASAAASEPAIPEPGPPV